MTKTQLLVHLRELRDRIETNTGYSTYSTGLCMIPARDLIDTLDLILEPPPTVTLDGDRDGETFDPEIDFERLNRQMKAVWREVRDGSWWTLRQLSLRTGMPEASVSARLRDLRKEKFGSQEVQRRRAGNGLWQYRVVRASSA